MQSTPLVPDMILENHPWYMSNFNFKRPPKHSTKRAKATKRKVKQKQRKQRRTAQRHNRK